MPSAPTLTADEIPQMIESPEFAALPHEQRTQIAEDALADAARGFAGKWDQPTFQKFGQFADTVRGQVAGMESVGEKAKHYGSVVLDAARGMGRMAIAGAADLSALNPDGSMRVPGSNLAEQAGIWARKADDMGGRVLSADSKPLDTELARLKSEIDQGNFPLNDQKALGDWLEKQHEQVKQAQTRWYADAQNGDPWPESYADTNGLLNPNHATLLSRYMQTRSPAAWDALTKSLSRTPRRAEIDAQQQKSLEGSPIVGLLSDTLGQDYGEHMAAAGDPLLLAMSAFPAFRAAGAVARAGEATALQLGKEVAKTAALNAGIGIAEAGVNEPGSNWEDYKQAAKDMMAVGFGFHGAGATVGKLAQAIRARRTGEPIAPRQPAQVTSEPNPFEGPIDAPPQPTETGGIVPETPRGPQQFPISDITSGITDLGAGTGDVTRDFGNLPKTPEYQARIEAERRAYEQGNARTRAAASAAKPQTPIIPDAPYGGRDILDFVNDNVINVPRKGEASKSGEYDWMETADIPRYYRQFLMHTERGSRIDQVAQRAYDEGLISDPTPDALIKSVQDTIAARTQYKIEVHKQQKSLLDQERRPTAFDKAQTSSRKEGGKSVPFDMMQKGDSLTIDGEHVQVKGIDYDQDGYPQIVTLEGGKRFGVLQFDANTRGGIVADEWKPKAKVSPENASVTGKAQQGSPSSVPVDAAAREADAGSSPATGGNDERIKQRIANGLPVPVYHGSPKTDLSVISGYSSWTHSRDLAAKYAGKEGRIYETFATIPANNPLAWIAHGNDVTPFDFMKRRSEIKLKDVDVSSQHASTIPPISDPARPANRPSGVAADPAVETRAQARASSENPFLPLAPEMTRSQPLDKRATGERMAPEGGAAQTNEPSPGGLSEADGKYLSALEQGDEQGVSLIGLSPVVYHGTPDARFEEFSSSAEKRGAKPDQIHSAFYFTDHMETAQGYRGNGYGFDDLPGNPISGDVHRMSEAEFPGGTLWWWDKDNRKQVALADFKKANRKGQFQFEFPNRFQVALHDATSTASAMKMIREWWEKNARRANYNQHIHSGLISARLITKKPRIIDADGAGFHSMTHLIRQARDQGFDSVIIRNLIDVAQNPARAVPQTTFVVFSPVQIQKANAGYLSESSAATQIITSQDSVLGSPVPVSPSPNLPRSNTPATPTPLPTMHNHGSTPAAATPGVTWSGEMHTLHGLRKFLLDKVGLPSVGVGRLTRALGTYYTRPEAVRLITANDIPVLAHEVGHSIHARILSPDRGMNGYSDFAGRYDSELMPLGQPTSHKNYTPDQVRMEGVAEFTRLWLTNPAAALAKAPSFAAHWEAELNAKAPQMADGLREARRRIADYIAMPAVVKAQAAIVRDIASERGSRSVGQWLRGAYAKWVNTLQPAMDAMREAGSIDPALKTEAQTVISRMDNHRGGWQSRSMGDVEMAQTNIHGQVIGPSLKEILKDLKPGDETLLDTYLALKRAKEIEASGRRSAFENAHPPAAEMKLLESRFERMRQKILKYQDNEIQLLIDGGILSPKSAAAMRAQNKDYVPFYRLFEKLNGVSFGPDGGKNSSGYVDLNSGIRRLKGSDRAIISPLQSILKNTFMFRKIAEQNQIANSFFKVMEQTQGHGKWGQEVRPKSKPTTTSHEAIVKKLIDEGVIKTEADLPMGADLTLTLWQAMHRPDTKTGEVIFHRGGEPQHWEIKEPLLMEALKTADMDAVKLWKMGETMTKVLTAPTRALRFGATGHPAFAIPNFFRDQFTAGVYSKAEKGFVPFVDGLRGAISVLRKKDGMLARWEQAGGRFSGLVTNDTAFQNMLDDIVPKDPSIRGRIAQMRDVRHVTRAIGAAGKLLEEATRVGEFRKGIESGMNDMDAANASKAVTLNFARAGERSRALNMLTAFFNAKVQDVDQFVRMHADPETRARTMRRAFTYITVPSMLAWWLGKDDKEIQALPDWRKNLFWNINLRPVAAALGRGDAGFILSLPKPFLLGAVYGTMVERALDQATGRDPNGARKALENVGANLIGMGEIVNGFSAFRPLVEAQFNHDNFTGKPIVPDRLQNLPKPQQYDIGTSETAKIIGAWTGQSPLMIDHLVRGYFATAGTAVVGGIDMAMAKLGLSDIPDPPSKDIMERYVFNRFSGSPYAANAFVGRFYDAAKDMEGTLSVLNKQAAGMTTAAREKWWNEHKQEVLTYESVTDPRTGRTHAGDVRHALERMSEINTAMKNVQASREIKPDDKRAKMIELKVMRDQLAENAFKSLIPEPVRRRHY